MKLELTRKSDLAVRALLELHRRGRTVKASEMAEAIGSTPGLVPHVMGPLVQAGWATSVPGPHGGYRLLVHPEKISVLSVIEAIEGPVRTDVCVLRGGPCHAEGVCALHAPWTEARTALLDSLAHTPIDSTREGT